MKELHTHPEGQQLLMFFKVDQFVPFNPSLLESTRHVMAQNAKLEEQMRRRTSVN
jgi:hypothetical protein